MPNSRAHCALGRVTGTADSELRNLRIIRASVFSPFDDDPMSERRTRGRGSQLAPLSSPWTAFGLVDDETSATVTRFVQRLDGTTECRWILEFDKSVASAASRLAISDDTDIPDRRKRFEGSPEIILGGGEREVAYEESVRGHCSR